MNEKNSNAVRVGVLGLDTPHAIKYTRMLNDSADPNHVPGARVIAACPFSSPDWAMSGGRVEKFTSELREKYQIPIYDSPEAVAEAADIILMESVDGRLHLDLYRKIARYRRPTFIDKPIAPTLAETKEIYRLAAENHTAVMASSSLRYSPPLLAALQDQQKVFGCEVYGPLMLEAAQPGWFWYGIHSVEILSAIMGTGCAQVQCVATEDHEVLTATWRDGRIATVRGSRAGHKSFGATIHREQAAQAMDLPALDDTHRNLLRSIMATLPHQKSAVSPEQTCEIIAILEAANVSRQHGQRVSINF